MSGEWLEEGTSWPASAGGMKSSVGEIWERSACVTTSLYVESFV